MTHLLRRLGLILSALAACSIVTARAQTAPAWVLVWSDEFSQPDGSSPNPAKWGYDLGGGGFGNNELQSYTSRTNNCRIENGMLVIEAKKEAYTGSDNIPRNYTSARIKTQNKWSWTFGRIEGRIKIPRGQGLWPAFWMLGSNIGSAGWPACGEIDIMENIGAEPSTVHGTIHGPGYSGGNSIGGGHTLAGGGAFADDFHVFAIEWETNKIRWYVDGQLYFNVNSRGIPAGSQWVFNAPEFLILNVAVGGNWPGPPNASTTFPQRMTVDYVRVYGQTNLTTCGGNALTNPGFENSGFGNWAAYGAGFNTSLANSPVRSGTNAFKVFGQFNGGDNYSGIYQDIPCSPGDSFKSTGHLFTPANDRIAGANTAWLEVSFRDASGNILSLFRTALISSASPSDTWLNLAVTNQVEVASGALIGTATNLVAPSGTSFIRQQIVFRQQANAAGAVYLDDLALLRPGATEFPVAVSASVQGEEFQLSFPTILSAPYQVQFKQSFADASWLPLSALAGTGTVCSFSDMIGTAQRFYRVVRLCN